MSEMNRFTEAVDEYRNVLRDSQSAVRELHQRLCDEIIPQHVDADKIASLLKDLRSRHDEMYREVCSVIGGSVPVDADLKADEYVSLANAAVERKRVEDIDESRSYLEQFLTIINTQKPDDAALKAEQDSIRTTLGIISDPQAVADIDLDSLRDEAQKAKRFLAAVTGGAEAQKEYALAIQDSNVNLAFGLLAGQYVLREQESPEATKASVAADVDAPKSAQKEQGGKAECVAPVVDSGPSCKADEPSVTWESLGVADPERLIFSFPEDRITVTDGKVNETFGAKKFNRFYSKSPGTASTKQYLLDLLSMNGAVSADMAHALCTLAEPRWSRDGQSRESRAECLERFDRDFAVVTELFVKEGYFSRVEIDGLDACYALTPKGCRILNTRSCLEKIGLHARRDRAYETLNRHETLVEQLHLHQRMHTFTRTVSASGRIPLEQTAGLKPRTARYRYTLWEDSPSLTWLVCNICTPDDLMDIAELVVGPDADAPLFVVLAQDKEHSEAIAEWISEHLSEELDGRELWYAGLEDQSLWTMDGTRVDLATYFGEGSWTDAAADVEGSADTDVATGVDVFADDEPVASAGMDSRQKIEREAEPDAAAESADKKASIRQDRIKDEEPAAGPSWSGEGQAKSASEADVELRDTAHRETPLSSELDVPASEKAEEDAARYAEEFIISTMNSLDETEEMQLESAFEEDDSPGSDAAGATEGREEWECDREPGDTDAHMNVVMRLLADGQYHSAAAYLYTLRPDSQLYQSAWLKLAYALNDPMSPREYNSSRVLELWDGSVPSRFGEACATAAAMRSFFLDESRYDYELDRLFTYVNGQDGTGNVPAAAQLLHELKEFKAKYHHGVDAYAGYQFEEQQSNEQRIKDLVTRASNQFGVNVGSALKGNIRYGRFLKARKRLLGENGDLCRHLLAVKNDDRNAVREISDFLADTYLACDVDVTPQNIDENRINDVISRAWEEVGSEVNMRKEGADMPANMRQALVRKIRPSVEILAEYVQLMDAHTEKMKEPGLLEYRRKRAKLLQLFGDAERQLSEHSGEGHEEKAADAILLKTVRDLSGRLRGTEEGVANRHLYVPFLLSSDIMLDEAYLPVLEDVPDVPSMLARARILRHAQAHETSLEARLRTICVAEDGEDYGSAELIAEYLKRHPEQIEDAASFQELTEKGFGYQKPKLVVEQKLKDWQGELEYAESRGLLDSAGADVKGFMLETVEYWCEQTELSQNFRFLDSVISSLHEKISLDSQVVAQELREDLEIWKERNQGWEKKDAKKDAVDQITARIREQDYTAAEDLLSRLRTNDLDVDRTAESENYLDEFLREYDVCSKRAGLANRAIQTNPSWLKRSNKDTKGAKRLFEYWPKQQKTRHDQTQRLLETLGFRSPQVEWDVPTSSGYDCYSVKLDFSQSRGTPGTYRHPVSAFGSEAERDSFRVVAIQGKMDASRLVDTYDELGDGKHTLVLLDYTLTLPERRRMARRIKAKFNGGSFIVLDRTALMFLAAHYSETAVNRMLMAVLLPFGASSLYQPNSAHDMPPELFIGRKKELDRIKNPKGVNIVYGGRQLGKTALLRKAQKDIDKNERGDRAVYVDIKGRNYQEAAQHVSEELCRQGLLSKDDITDDWRQLAGSIKSRLGSEDGRIPFFLLLLDEADVFIDSCREVKYQPLDELKGLQYAMPGQFKFVVAGLHDVVRLSQESALGDNSVLPQMESLPVTPFKYREARQLLREPLSYTGFQFPDDDETARLISTIFSTTNYFPGLLQLYASKLAEALEHGYAGYAESGTPPYVVSEELIRNVLKDESVLQQINEKFQITIRVDSGGDNYYYWLAMLAAFHVYTEKTLDGFTPDDLKRHATDYGIAHIADQDLEVIRALMDEMRALNIFTLLANGRYRFARRRFLSFMGSYQDVDNAMAEYENA